MKKAFTSEADFSRINGEKDLKLSDVLHKTFFEFNEAGIEASAAAASRICYKTAVSMHISSIPFVLDHPFYFVLLDANTETIFFMGYIKNP